MKHTLLSSELPGSLAPLEIKEEMNDVRGGISSKMQMIYSFRNHLQKGAAGVMIKFPNPLLCSQTKFKQNAKLFTQNVQYGTHQIYQISSKAASLFFLF